MMVLNIKELCFLRGIENPHKALKKAGISHYVALEYLKGNKYWVITGHIEILCKLLRCSPNDIYKWVPDDPSEDYPENPMQKLRYVPLPKLKEKIKNLSAEDLQKLLDGLG